EDTPERVRQAIAAKDGPMPAKQGTASAETVRQQGLKYLADARNLQKQGQLLPALEASVAAQRSGAVFAPRDETPEQVLADLKRDSGGQIDTCMAVAETLAAHGRYQDAESYLQYSRQLAIAFKLPCAPIDKQLAQLRGDVESGIQLASKLDPEVDELV